MKRLFLLSLLMSLCLGLGAQEEAVRLIAENPDRASNNMHSYEFDPIVDTKAPKGFKPFYITHYGRHGSRYEQNHTFARAAIHYIHVAAGSEQEARFFGEPDNGSCTESLRGGLHYLYAYRL